MAPLNRKLLRDLWHMRGQFLAIALVLAGGVATLVLSVSTHGSLKQTRDAYYERHRFAHVFAFAKRAPETLAERIAALPGVRRVETRIVKDAILDMPGLDAPARARITSLPDSGVPVLNAPALSSGRLFRPRSDDEVLVGERFAEAHG